MIRFNHRLFGILLLILAVCGISCNRRSGMPQPEGKTVADSHGTSSADDSAQVLFARIDHYYKNVMHDSLYALAPVAMDYNRRHQQWKEYYTTWCLLVNDLVWNGQMDKGFNEAQQMHHDAIQRNNAFGISEAYTAMGIAYHFQGDDKESAHCYQQALQYYPQDADQSVKQNIYSYYCQVLVEMKDYKTTEQVFDLWEQFLSKQTGGDTENPKYAHWLFRFHRERYKFRYALQHYDEAAKELDDMQHFLEKEQDRTLYEAQVAGFRTQLALARKDYTQAMAYNDWEIELSRQQDFNTFLNALKHRSELLQQLGRYEEALKAWRSYDEQKDSLIKADTRQQLNELNKRFEVDELKAQQERDLLEHERSQLRLVLAFAAIVVVALVLFIIFRHRADRRLKEAHALLEKSNAELQQSYENLQVAKSQAEESSKMKSNFIRQISHEIRTPLNVLSGFTQILTTPGVELDDEEKADISQRITENTDRITQLVYRMLELSEASSMTVIERNDTALPMEIATEAIDESGIRKAQHIDFETHYADDTDTVMLKTSQRQAARALSQLLDNAKKFTKEGTVALRVEKSGDTMNFIVEDTGIGIPPAEADHIFDEFVQLDEYYDGTGIGLTVARSIARRLGGDVALDPAYTGGSRFVLSLPT